MKLIDRVAIIDYQMNNLFSIEAACKYNKVKTIITSDHEEIMSSKFSILPGVGAFNGYGKIKILKLDIKIYDTGRPFLNMFRISIIISRKESLKQGFRYHGRKIRKFNFKNHNFKFHIGWNKIKKEKSWAKTILKESTENKLKYLYILIIF